MRGNHWIMKGPFIRVVAHVSKNLCKFKTEKLGKIKKKYKFYQVLNNYACKETLNNWKHHSTRVLEKSRFTRPCTSRDRLVTIPNLSMVAPAIGLNQLTGIFHLLSSQSRKIQASLVDTEISMSLNMMSKNTTVVPSITNQLLFSWRNLQKYSFETAIWFPWFSSIFRKKKFLPPTQTKPLLAEQ